MFIVKTFIRDYLLTEDKAYLHYLWELNKYKLSVLLTSMATLLGSLSYLIMLL